MTEVTKQKENLFCRYCQIDLDPIADKKNGFIQCPSCERNYLKLSKKALPKSGFELSLDSKKVLDLFASPRSQLDELNKLQEKLSEQEAIVAELRSQSQDDGFVSNDENESLLLQVADLKNKNAEQEERLLASNAELEHQQNLLGDRNQESIELKESLALTKQQLAEKEDLLFALQKESSFKDLTLASVQNNNVEAKTLLIAREEEISFLSKTLEETEAEKLALQEIAKVIPDLEMEVENAKLRVTELQETIERNLYTVAGDDGWQQVELLNAEVLALKDDIKEYLKTIQSLELQIDAYEKAESNANQNSRSDAQNASVLKESKDRIESLESELHLTRDELEKAKIEITGLNQMLDGASCEKQEILTNDSEHRVNTQLEVIKEQLSSVSLLRQDVYVTRINADGEQKKTVLFDKGLVLPKNGLEIKKEISYVASRNKGAFLYESSDVLSLLHIDFSSNLNFFVSESEFVNLEKKDVQVAIREEYTLKSDGSFEVVFYRNNGFKRFEQVIGKIETKAYELNLH